MVYLYRMPRTALHPDDKRSIRFPVSLSPSEAELIDKAAAKSLDARAEFMRNHSKAAARRILRKQK